MTKTAVQESLEKMPDEFPVEELIERLLFVQNVQEGLLQSERGETVPLEEVRQRLRKWSV
jgi:predicted transcriptional regulator